MLRRAHAYVVNNAGRVRAARAALDEAKTDKQRTKAQARLDKAAAKYEHYRARIGLVHEAVETRTAANPKVIGRWGDKRFAALLAASPIALDVASVKAGYPDADGAMQRLLDRTRPIVAKLVADAAHSISDLDIEEAWSYADEGIYKAVIGGEKKGKQKPQTWIPPYDQAPNSASFPTYAYKRVLRELQINRTQAGRPIGVFEKTKGKFTAPAKSLSNLGTDDEGAKFVPHAVGASSSKGVIQNVDAETSDAERQKATILAVQGALSKLDDDEDRWIATELFVAGTKLKKIASALGITQAALSARVAEIHEFLTTALAEFQEEF